MRRGPSGVPDDGSDADVVADVLAGQPERFRLLVERHEDALFRHALSLGMDRDTAADMVQDTLVRAWERLSECRDPARFRLWAGRILRNRCLDRLKSARQRTTTSLESLPNGALGPDESREGNPESEAELRSLEAALDGALATLPPDLAEAFVLKHVEGFSYDEMAEMTEVSRSALKMRVHRARDAIRACLEASGFEPM